MTQLTITIPRDGALESYLFSLPHTYHVIDESSESVCFLYGGFIPPLAKISQLLAIFEPSEYTISRRTTGFSFIVWSKD